MPHTSTATSTRKACAYALDRDPPPALHSASQPETHDHAFGLCSASQAARLAMQSKIYNLLHTTITTQRLKSAATRYELPDGLKSDGLFLRDLFPAFALADERRWRQTALFTDLSHDSPRLSVRLLLPRSLVPALEYLHEIWQARNSDVQAWQRRCGLKRRTLTAPRPPPATDPAARRRSRRARETRPQPDPNPQPAPVVPTARTARPRTPKQPRDRTPLPPARGPPAAVRRGSTPTDLLAAARYLGQHQRHEEISQSAQWPRPPAPSQQAGSPRVSPFDFDVLLFPIHSPGHWTFAAIHSRLERSWPRFSAGSSSSAGNATFPQTTHRLAACIGHQTPCHKPTAPAPGPGPRGRPEATGPSSRLGAGTARPGKGRGKGRGRGTTVAMRPLQSYFRGPSATPAPPLARPTGPSTVPGPVSPPFPPAPSPHTPSLLPLPAAQPRYPAASPWPVSPPFPPAPSPHTPSLLPSRSPAPLPRRLTRRERELAALRDSAGFTSARNNLLARGDRGARRADRPRPASPAPPPPGPPPPPAPPSTDVPSAYTPWAVTAASTEPRGRARSASRSPDLVACTFDRCGPSKAGPNTQRRRLLPAGTGVHLHCRRQLGEGWRLPPRPAPPPRPPALRGEAAPGARLGGHGRGPARRERRPLLRPATPPAGARRPVSRLVAPAHVAGPPRRARARG
eukprot:tig00000903_g5530.t1